MNLDKKTLFCVFEFLVVGYELSISKESVVDCAVRIVQ
jgi:hypothetical protein